MADGETTKYDPEKRIKEANEYFKDDSKLPLSIESEMEYIPSKIMQSKKPDFEPPSLDELKARYSNDQA